MTALLAAAEEAPTSAGVYFFLSADRGLLYIGKASNLRRRLQQHAKETPLELERRRTAMYALVHEVRWEIVADDDAACAREADLIVALQPVMNASIRGDGRWAYLVVTRATGDATTDFQLTAAPGARRGVYGCFPHLGKGVGSVPGIACSDGYPALLRLLWSTGPAAEGDHYPRTIAGASAPPSFRVEVAEARVAALHRFLSGTSARLLDDLAVAVGERDPVRRPALRRDLELARAFFVHGPAAIRRLRLRHGLPPRPIGRPEIEALLREEVRASIGDVRFDA